MHIKHPVELRNQRTPLEFSGGIAVDRLTLIDRVPVIMRNNSVTKLTIGPRQQICLKKLKSVEELEIQI